MSSTHTAHRKQVSHLFPLSREQTSFMMCCILVRNIVYTQTQKIASTCCVHIQYSSFTTQTYALPRQTLATTRKYAMKWKINWNGRTICEEQENTFTMTICISKTVFASGKFDSMKMVKMLRSLANFEQIRSALKYCGALWT